MDSKINEAGSIDLYPAKTTSVRLRTATFPVELLGFEVLARLFVGTNVRQVAEDAAYSGDRSVPWGAETRTAAPFVRIDVDTGFFFEHRTRLIATNYKKNERLYTLHALNCIQTLLGDDFCDQHAAPTRPYDPTDFRKKRPAPKRGGYNEGEKWERDDGGMPSRCEILSRDELSASLSAHQLWNEEIPKAFSRVMMLGSFEAPKDAGDFLQEVGPFAIDQWEKDIPIKSKQRNFKRRYGDKMQGASRTCFISFCQRAFLDAHEDLRSYSAQAISQASSPLEAEMRATDAAASKRYATFWYGLAAPAAQATGLVLAATPFRSFVHRQAYAVLDSFERDVFVAGSDPRKEVSSAILAYIMSYNSWLEISREYDRRRHRRRRRRRRRRNS